MSSLCSSGPKEAVGWLAFAPGLGALASAFDGASLWVQLSSFCKFHPRPTKPGSGQLSCKVQSSPSAQLKAKHGALSIHTT